MNILTYPALPKGSDRDDLLARLTWYLLPVLENDSSQIVILSDSTLPKEIKVPEYLDRRISEDYKKFRSLVKTTRKLENKNKWIEDNDVLCLCFDKEQIGDVQNIGFTEVVSVDPVAERFESSKYLRAISRDGLIPDHLVKAYKARFNLLKDRCAGRTVGIFGTGPSLDDVDGEIFDKCFNIATNSMVVNRELLDILKPEVIVASDPIFHAGASSYAEDFRGALIKAVQDFDTYFVFPARDYHIYEHYLPEIRDRLIGIPMIAGHATASARMIEKRPKMGRRAIARTRQFINTNMGEDFHSVVTNNVMTFFLLPMAASLSNRAIGAGFDGRDPDADEYFWGHAKKSQINSKMDAISDAHPGFFDIDYNEYLREHTLTLERQLIQLQDAGFSFGLITFSHLPPLKPHLLKEEDVGQFIDEGPSRPPKIKEKPFDGDRSEPIVSIIMPNYNAGAFIYQAIVSIISQTLENWELIIVDNGSSDISLEWIKSFVEADPRVKYIYNPIKGVSASRNVGIREARGQYICFLDSDDELWSQSLENRVAHAEKNDASIVYGRSAFIDKNSSSLGHVTGARKDLQGSDFLTSCPVHTGTVMGRAEIIKTQEFREDLTNGEDYLFFAKMARLGYRYQSLGDVRVGAYRIHANSVTQANFHYHNRQLSSVFDYLNSDVDNHPWYLGEKEKEIPENFFLNQVVMRDLQSLTFLTVKGEYENMQECMRMIDDAVTAGSDDYIEGYATSDIQVKIDSLEVVAMRAHAIPRGLEKLYRAVSDNADLAVEVLKRWLGKEDVRGMFANRIQALVQRAANRVHTPQEARKIYPGLYISAPVKGSATKIEPPKKAELQSKTSPSAPPSPSKTDIVSKAAVEQSSQKEADQESSAPDAKKLDGVIRSSDVLSLNPKFEAKNQDKSVQNLLAGNQNSKWFLDTNTASSTATSLKIDRNGNAFQKNASFILQDVDGPATLSLDISKLEKTLLIYHNRHIVESIKGTGSFDIGLDSVSHGDTLSFAVADGSFALAEMTSITLKPVRCSA